MVETILFNLASKVVSKIGSVALQEVGQAWGVEQELKTLEGTLSTINAVLVDAERLHGDQAHYSIVTGLWYERLQAAFYEADDLLDEFHYEVLRRQVQLMRMNHCSSSSIGIQKELVRKFLSFSHTLDLPFTFKMGTRIKKIRKRLDMIADDRNKFHPIVTTSQQNVPSASMSSNVNESEFVGRDNDRVQLLELIMTPSDYDENLMPEIIHDLAVFMANKECLSTTNYRSGPISDKVKHVSFHDFDCSGEEEVTKSLFKLENLRTIFFPFQGLGAGDKSFVNRCISKFKYLYVLDLSNSCFQGGKTLVALRGFNKLKCTRFYESVALPVHILEISYQQEKVTDVRWKTNR
ncbi:putative disease resistance protein RGA1 [Camellia lanceoleosa]|uniref:Disease resistance protein RGA1 n=1 Tax=Camellia lanceoleosa TaxID=1840588 RepID=A0ACC0G8W0_9ERIC|nr:putative disease resistance protein RGA1 [Camellia lanceoleosa]